MELIKKKVNLGRAVIVAAILLSPKLMGQTSFRAGNKAYEKQSYVQAVKHYEGFIDQAKSNDKNLAEAYSKLAFSYKKLQDYRNAERIYRKLLKQYEAILDSKEYLYFAQVLASNSKYHESQLYYSKYGEQKVGDKRARNFASAYMDISPFYRDSSLYQVRYLSQINSRQADFSPMYYGQGLVYVSSRNEKGGVRRIFMNNQTPFLDLYEFPDTTTLLRGLHDLTEGKSAQIPEGANQEFSKNLNSKYHEGPVAFFNGNNQIIFTRNSSLKSKAKSGLGVNHLKLFSAKFTGSKWDFIKALPFNSNEYSCGHPALNAENTKLVFVSDMPGGFGGTDLYEVNYNNGQWDVPQNMGPQINSEGDEMFPFVDEFGDLYFASDGHAGLGGLDIFYAELTGNKVVLGPENLGTPVNSPQDDFGLITNGDRTTGFFSSNRKKGYSDDNIYSFNRHCRKLKVLVYDLETREPIREAEVRLLNRGVNKELFITNKNGEIELCISAGLNFDFKAFKEGYKASAVNYATMITSPNSESKISLYLRASKLPLVKGTIRSELTDEPLEGVTVVLKNQQDKSTETVITGSDGKYMFQPSKRGRYVVTAVKDKYAANTEKIGVVKGLFRNKASYEQNLAMIGEGDIFRIDNIYYDYGKHTIRNDAKKSLDDLVLPILKKYPQISIEIRSHTDSRSSTDFNAKLSELRAKEVANFLSKRGVDPERLKYRGLGETMLVNGCIDGVNCTESEHQQNRRTEFKIANVGQAVTRK